MLTAQEIQAQIDHLHYWDARVLRLSSEYFGDEVTLEYEDTDGNVLYHFLGCSRVLLETDGSERVTPLRDLSTPQLPYFLQDVVVSEVDKDGAKLYNCKISMPPLCVDILCKEIKVRVIHR